jgi:NAD(P)-dependent dehydrogenase (short-subunit alcohol dehydrogenase family)
MKRLAVVTGAGSGVGRATADVLAGRGLEVICVGRRRGPLAETAELIGGGSVVAADVSSSDGVAAVADAVGNRRVATVVHAAAIEGLVSLADTDRETFDALVATNLGGPFFLTKALMSSIEDGVSVIFISSVAAVRGRTRHAAYSATKAGLLGLTVNLAAELAPRVRVNCVALGAVQTPMFEEAVTTFLSTTSPEEAEAILAPDRARLLLGVAQPQQVAATIAHLALDASFCTGSVVFADGGYTAR